MFTSAARSYMVKYPKVLLFHSVLAKASKENRGSLYQLKMKVTEEVNRQNKLRLKQILAKF
jgi:hypothetical protein